MTKHAVDFQVSDIFTLYTGQENISCFTKIIDLFISERAKTEKNDKRK
jgi:hypothetical protein